MLIFNTYIFYPISFFLIIVIIIFTIRVISLKNSFLIAYDIIDISVARGPCYYVTYRNKIESE